MTKRTSRGTARLPSPAPASAPASRTSQGDSDDEYLAAVLIRMWSQASGRTLRRDVPLDQLSTEELIAFWADDMTPRTGRHARAAVPDRTADPRATAMTARPVPKRRGKGRRRPIFRRTARSRQEHPAG